MADYDIKLKELRAKYPAEADGSKPTGYVMIAPNIYFMVEGNNKAYFYVKGEGQKVTDGSRSKDTGQITVKSDKNKTELLEAQVIKGSGEYISKSFHHFGKFVSIKLPNGEEYPISDAQNRAMDALLEGAFPGRASNQELAKRHAAAGKAYEAQVDASNCARDLDVAAMYERLGNTKEVVGQQNGLAERSCKGVPPGTIQRLRQQAKDKAARTQIPDLPVGQSLPPYEPDPPYTPDPPYIPGPPYAPGPSVVAPAHAASPHSRAPATAVPPPAAKADPRVRLRLH